MPFSNLLLALWAMVSPSALRILIFCGHYSTPKTEIETIVIVVIIVIAIPATIIAILITVT